MDTKTLMMNNLPYLYARLKSLNEGFEMKGFIEVYSPRKYTCYTFNNTYRKYGIGLPQYKNFDGIRVVLENVIPGTIIDTLYPNSEISENCYEGFEVGINTRHDISKPINDIILDWVEYSVYMYISKNRTGVLKRELMEKTWHPQRVQKLLEAGIEVEAF